MNRNEWRFNLLFSIYNLLLLMGDGRCCFWLENGVFGNIFVNFQKKPVSAVDDGVRFAFIYIEE
ncbi:MAG: hypothetical protein KAR47_14370, partial [Planctomycetes bacterium]|nr:hypothetical protein [Planctomycetota bacterium]